MPRFTFDSSHLVGARTQVCKHHPLPLEHNADVMLQAPSGCVTGGKSGGLGDLWGKIQTRQGYFSLSDLFLKEMKSWTLMGYSYK